MNGPRRRSLLTAAAAAALAAGAHAPASAGATGYAAGTECHEQQAFVEGDPEVVAARLPEGYAPLRTASGRPLVFARGLRCQEMALEGVRRPAINASYGVVIESPDGRGCGSAAPGAGSVKGDVPPVCNWYVLSWLSNDRRVVDWLRRGTPGFPAVHVPDLSFDLGAVDPARGGAPVSFRAGGPSPYEIEAVGRENPREISVRGGYWADTPQGTVKLALSSDDLRAGDGEGVVRARPGSDLAALLGAGERRYEPPFSAFASVHAGRGVYRKQILPPPGSTEGFAGSCSLKGQVTFDPPASNTPQPLFYDYTAEGTCSGTLDGREVSEAPVSVYQSGRSEGGCRAAKTTEPGSGTMTFASGEAIRYTLDFTTQSTEVSGTLYGERSGTAPGRGTFATDRTPPEVFARCAGSGTREVPMDISFTTHTALVNEPRRPGGEGPGGEERQRLRLAVSPRTVRSGSRTAFTFRVTTADGRAAAGAFVRFFGRRVQTGRSGTARIVARLRARGPHAAGAKLPGFRGARATIRVRG